MSGEDARDDGWQHRFPGFSVVGQARHWDDATREVVLDRLAPPKPIRYLPEEVRPAGVALVAQIVAVDDEFARALLGAIDVRLQTNQTDGWHYDTMPIDHDAWTRSLAGLDEDARSAHGAAFAELAHEQQHDLLEGIRTSDAEQWHGMPPARIWNLWTRYVCTAFYAHPFAWDEIGFGGPAYPRGYKNRGVDAREPYEVQDTRPHMDPTIGTLL